MAKFKVGDKVAVLLSTQYLEYPVAEVFDGLGNVWYTLRGYGDVKERDVASPALWKYKDGTRVKTKDGKNGMVIGRAWDFYDKEPSYKVKLDEGGASGFFSQRYLRLANARPCNSTNPVVRKAFNATRNAKIIPELQKHIPSKLLPHVQEAFKDSDGYWIWFDDSVDTKYDPHSPCATIHEDTIGEVKAALRKCVVTNGKWVVLYRDGGKEKIDAPSHAEAKRIADEKSQKSGRGYISVIVDDGVDYGINAAAKNATDWEKVYQIKGMPVKLVWRGEPFNDLKATVESGNRTYVPVARIIASNPVSQTEAEKLCAAKWRQIKAIANAVKTTNAVVAKALNSVRNSVYQTETELERAIGAKLGKSVDVGIDGNAVSIGLESKGDIEKAVAVVKEKLGDVVSYKYMDGSDPWLQVTLKTSVPNAATKDAVAREALNYSPYHKGRWLHDHKSGRNFTVVREEHWGKDSRGKDGSPVECRCVTLRDSTTGRIVELPTTMVDYRFHLGEVEACDVCNSLSVRTRNAVVQKALNTVAANAKFAVTTKSGRSVVIEAPNYKAAEKEAKRRFGAGCIVNLVGNSVAAGKSVAKNADSDCE